MVSASAVSRKHTAGQSALVKSQPVVGAQAAQLIADVWMNISSTESALADLASMQAGILMWNVAPTMQSIMAAMAGPVLEETDRIYCAGFQCYPWSVAATNDIQSVATQYLGKSFPKNIHSMSVDDICAQIPSSKKKSGMAVACLHIENVDGWKDVRAVAAAAVKSATPALILVSSAVPAPAGAMVETLVPNVIDQWHVAGDAIQTAVAQVRGSGAIRVIACLDDVSSAAAENANMMASGLKPAEWKSIMKEIRQDGERAMWSALRAPCKTY